MRTRGGSSRRDQGAGDGDREREDAGEVFASGGGAVPGEAGVVVAETHGQRASGQDAPGGGAGAVETVEAMRGASRAGIESVGTDV